MTEDALMEIRLGCVSTALAIQGIKRIEGAVLRW